MLETIRNYLNFNKGERIGIMVFIAIIIIVLFTPRMIDYAFEYDKKEYDRYAQDIKAFENSLKQIKDSVDDARKFNFQQMDKSIAENRLAPFTFNPNLLPSEQWSKMGLKDWQIKVIKNYEAKGGKFYKKDDFKKLFCISPSEYKILEPYISIPEQHVEYSKNIPVKKERVLIDLNEADSVTMLTLNGIGPSYAKRIIKYRELLGGFYSKQQLLEVYGFDQERLDKIKEYCMVNADRIKKININTIRTDELKKHPYFDYYTAKALVDQRIILGRYTSIQQIKEIPLIHEELYNKIKIYINIQ